MTDTENTGAVTDEDLTAVIMPLYALSTGMLNVISGKPTVTRQSMLAAVQSTPGVRPSQVATALKLHQSQVTRQLQALEDEGLLDSAEDPQDRRSRRLTLTEAGLAELHRLNAYGLNKWHRFVADFEPGEVRELGRLLSKLHTSIAAATTSSRRP